MCAYTALQFSAIISQLSLRSAVYGTLMRFIPIKQKFAQLEYIVRLIEHTPERNVNSQYHSCMHGTNSNSTG